MIEEQAFNSTNFFGVTYTGTRKPFCRLGAFPKDQEFSFTGDYNFTEFCGVKLYSEDGGDDDSGSGKKKKGLSIELIIIIAVSSAFF